MKKNEIRVKSTSFGGISISSICVSNGEVFVNGIRVLQDEIKECTEKSIKLIIEGNVGDITITNESLTCNDVNGNIELINGSIIKK